MPIDDLAAFSRSLGPSLRLGDMVLPHHLLHAASTLKVPTDNGFPRLEQAVLAQFMRNGSPTSHLDRRRDAVLASIAPHFGTAAALRAGGPRRPAPITRPLPRRSSCT